MVNEEKILKQRLKALENKYDSELFNRKTHQIPEPSFEPEVSEPEVKKQVIRKAPVLKKSISVIKRGLVLKPVKSKTRKIKPKLKIEKPKLAPVPELTSDPVEPVEPVESVEPIEESPEPEPEQEIELEREKISNPNRPSEIEIKQSLEHISRIKNEISKIVMGQERVVNGLIMGLLCNAHVLVEGVPGIAKTLAIRALATASGCSVKRIQFTVDMLPTDIIGLTMYTPKKGFEIVKGPIFANFVIADEINRAPPKTQSALMEAMQEKQVTIGRKRFHLPNPFFVMATENPIENAGVYPLPEAQIDRFLFKVLMGYPEIKNEKKVMESNITIKKFEDFGLKSVITPKKIVEIQEIVKRIYLDDNIKNYILAIVRKTRTKDFESAQYISYGSSPRASIGIFIASKARALMNGRNYVLPEDVKEVTFDVLRHRLILSYKATIKKISPDDIIKEILNSISVE